MSASDSARQVVECRVCGAADWQEVVSFGPVPLANSYLDPADSYDDEPRYPLDVVSCRSCRLMTLTHVVDPEVLYRDYSYVTSDSETMDRHMRLVAKLCRERFDVPEGSFVVELGSNTGEQLMIFRDAGMRTLGIDPARSIAAVAEEQGIETLPEFFSASTAKSVAESHGQARVILGRHVFAHIDHVAGIAVGVRNLLEPEGVFAIEVPYALDMLERTEFDTIYHEHLSYYAVGTLATLFERHGLRVIDVERISVHGGSILVFVGHGDGPWQQRPAVKELIALEERAGLHDDATYREFAAKVRNVTESLTALVRGLRADGKRIAGYGAPAKGNTLLTVCGLGPDDLEFCSDTTDLKQGKVLPGSHVPVRTPEYAREHAPDHYLLLAWNYTEEILRKERAFLESGGKFIVLHPEPSVVSAESLAAAESVAAARRS
ncbi:class I SAM-dependent methyltransferase [Streptomyces armeniacus]|uniref:Class I SAM-dependent methyltransferase n=1 Tax=Streptomyces armeniacus TaxID=83291 RepID=A0A345XXX4_9ACTN|nr:class I SAM-dependent methyltransferase [Streptomyces armeniacus]AXK36490.1 class I SAM-dependent methyltransferase [Streptomyces armeniacus]